MSETLPSAPVPTKPKPVEKPTQQKKRKSEQLPPFNVVLLDDNDHTYEYVIEMLKAVVGYDEQQGFLLARKVDEHGRAIVFTAHKELAELKCEQLSSFGTDARVASCRGSMTAIVEEAAEG